MANEDYEDEDIIYDNEGERWEQTKSGKLRTPEQGTKKDDGYYDTSRGHCCFCGRLICRGDCFK